MAAKPLKCKVLVAFVCDRLAPTAGQVIEAAPELVNDWARAGLVELVKDDPAPSGKKSAGMAETTALTGAPETAVGVRQRDKK
jgi:hypothetical protein